jgi:hypothetical protein
MGFWKELFSDDNHINEKSVVGFASFAVMVLAMIADLVTGYFGKDLVINEFIYNSFLVICLGSFGIGSIDKFINSKKPNSTEEEEG